MPQQESEETKVKCVVWDLDNTIWNGTLLEDPSVSLREGILDIIKLLDRRGILHSIASRNDYDLATAKLRDFGLEEYFLYPQINWDPKSKSIQAIAKAINIGTKAMAFVDDQPYEREEVGFTHPEVLCLDAERIEEIPDLPAMNPRFVTEESRQRRLMYLGDIKRNEMESAFVGPKEDFLAGLNMVLTISPAGQDDLQRAEELTVRTHQLNTTGYTFSYEELDRFSRSPGHQLLIAGLTDKYGSYGKIGLALIETTPEVWTIKLFLLSCRVMSRGVGTAFLNHLRNQARQRGVILRAEFLATDINRMMYMTYKFMNFREISQDGKFILFENDLAGAQAFPAYLTIVGG